MFSSFWVKVLQACLHMHDSVYVYRLVVCIHIQLACVCARILMPRNLNLDFLLCFFVSFISQATILSLFMLFKSLFLCLFVCLYLIC